MTQVRVLRLLEYTYEDQEGADADKMRWGVPANGAYEGGVSGYRGRQKVQSSPVLIRSAIIEHPFPRPPLTEGEINSTMTAVRTITTPSPSISRDEDDGGS